MMKWTGLMALALGASVMAAAGGPPQEKAAKAAVKASSLTAEDYIEIQQLVSRYGFALDTSAENGYMWANLFTPDGVFGNAKGREQLSAMARGGRKGPLLVRNFGGYAIIEPSAEGAIGWQYAQAIDFWEGAKPNSLDHFGHYEDVYVKTPEGWRFKSRTFVNESVNAPARGARPAR